MWNETSSLYRFFIFLCVCYLMGYLIFYLFGTDKKTVHLLVPIVYFILLFLAIFSPSIRRLL